MGTIQPIDSIDDIECLDVDPTVRWENRKICAGFRITGPINLNFGFLSSDSGEVFDESSQILTKSIAEGAMDEVKFVKNRQKIPEAERDKPKVEVTK